MDREWSCIWEYQWSKELYKCICINKYPKCLSNVGVFLDHSAGSLFLYSVSQSMIVLHRIQTTFTRLKLSGWSRSANDQKVGSNPGSPGLSWAAVSLSKILKPKLLLRALWWAGDLSRFYPTFTWRQLGLAPATNPATPWKRDKAVTDHDMTSHISSNGAFLYFMETSPGLLKDIHLCIYIYIYIYILYCLGSSITVAESWLLWHFFMTLRSPVRHCKQNCDTSMLFCEQV